MQRISVLGSPLSICDEAELLNYIGNSVQEQKHTTILSGNIYAYNLAYENSWLCQFFNSASAVRLDGAGVRLGARILGYSTPPRMTWADFGWSLANYAAENRFKLFLLGSKPGIAEAAAGKLTNQAPSLEVVGTHHGYFDKTQGSEENERILSTINAVEPDILIVGFGMPLQEQWLSENRERIQANVVITGGAVFDYLSGELRRGPRILTDTGFEWLARLLIEPRRLWRRYILGNPQFLMRIVRQRLGFLPIDAP